MTATSSRVVALLRGGKARATAHATTTGSIRIGSLRAGRYRLRVVATDARGAISVTERAAYIGRIRNLAREFGGATRQFVDPTFRLVQLQPVAIAPEGVRKDDVGPRIHELLVQSRHFLGPVNGPELGRLTRSETSSEEVRARGAIGEENPASGQQVGERCPHVLHRSSARRSA